MNAKQRRKRERGAWTRSRQRALKPVPLVRFEDFHDAAKKHVLPGIIEQYGRTSYLKVGPDGRTSYRRGS